LSDSPPDESRSPYNLFNKISTFLTVFAGLATLIYVLGLITLWVPIAKTYTHDFHMAWHAVSLVPRIVVAGLGVEQFVAFPLLLMLLTFSLVAVVEILLVVLRSIHSKVRGKRGETLNTARKFTRDRTIIAASVATAWGYIVFYAGWHIHESLPSATPVSIILWGLGFFSIALSLPFSVAVCSEREQSLAATFNAVADNITENTGRGRGEHSGANAGLVQNQSINTLLSTLKPRLSEIQEMLAIFVLWLLISYGVWLLLGKVAPLVLRSGAIHISTAIDHVIFLAVALLACVAVVYAAITYTLVNINNRRDSLLARLGPGYMARMVQWPRRWHGIALFTVSFLMAILLSFLRMPPLPIVEVNGGIHAEGRLLAHTEGFWYVFRAEEGELLAIPDSKVSNVRVRPIDEENRIH
jgi:hypothetical protein